MAEILRPKIPELKSCRELFTVHLPITSIAPISYDNLPGSLKRYIGSKENCGLSFKVVHPDSGITLVAEHSDFEVFFLQDRNKSDRYVGEGQIYVECGSESEIPIVGYTYTSKWARQQGLGTRRLFIMNTVSRLAFDSPVSSSASPRPTQRSIWEKLVEKEIAENYQWEGTPRYRFTV